MENKWKGKCDKCPGCNRMELDGFEGTEDCDEAMIFINESEDDQNGKSIQM